MHDSPEGRFPIPERDDMPNASGAPIKVLSVFGTRPEAIKMAPVLAELERHGDVFASQVCVSGQHREMLDQMLELFKIRPDFDLDVMQPEQTLTDLTVAVLDGLGPILAVEKPDWVLVQGDTTTTMAASLAAFYHGIPVGHVEAGLRTHTMREPRPEEMNRRVSAVLADLHFAPSAEAAENLLAEGIAPDRVFVTGNTVIDAFQQASALPFDVARSSLAGVPYEGKRLIVVTAHRRENFRHDMLEICEALKLVAEAHDDVHLVCPVHLNPNVQAPFYALLEGIENVTLLPPVGYREMVWLLQQCSFLITDSGGLQEEAAAIGKPVLVLRNVTERPEPAASGTTRLVGSKKDALVAAAFELLANDAVYDEMARPVSPYGTGDAAKRIVELLIAHSRVGSSSVPAVDVLEAG